MKILLLGYGKMGKEIERIALERGHEIVGRIDVNNQHELENLQKDSVDVGIEFSTPASAVGNIKRVSKKDGPLFAAQPDGSSIKRKSKHFVKTKRAHSSMLPTTA